MKTVPIYIQLMMPLFFYYCALPLVILIVWAMSATNGWVPTILLPAPWTVVESAGELITSGALWHHILVSASRTFTGFFFSVTLGFTLAFLFARNKKAHASGYLLIEALRVTPPLSVIPLLILWLGIGEGPKIGIVFLSSFFPVYLNTLSALRGVDPKLKEVAQVLGFDRMETLKNLTLPAAMPGILTGLRLGFGYSWRALVGAELVASSSGLGFMISEAGEFVQTDIVFVGIFTIAVLGIIADVILKRLVSRFSS